jgi:hypothetical protein
MRGTQHTGRMTTEGHADIEVHTAPLCTKKRARRHVNRIIECRASSVQVERRVSSIPTSSVERSSRASGSGQCPTVDRREDGRGVTVSAASTVEHRAFESSVGRRASGIPTSSVERSSRASGSGQCPTVDCREDGRGVTVSAASTVEYRAFESSVERRASSISTSRVGRSSRASGSGQHSTVDCREYGRGDGEVTSLQGYSVGSIDCRASSIERRTFQRPAWSVRVEHQDQASVRLSTVKRTSKMMER